MSVEERVRKEVHMLMAELRGKAASAKVRRF